MFVVEALQGWLGGPALSSSGLGHWPFASTWSARQSVPRGVRCRTLHREADGSASGLGQRPVASTWSASQSGTARSGFVLRFQRPVASTLSAAQSVALGVRFRPLRRKSWAVRQRTKAARVSSRLPPPGSLPKADRSARAPLQPAPLKTVGPAKFANGLGQRLFASLFPVRDNEGQALRLEEDADEVGRHGSSGEAPKPNPPPGKGAEARPYRPRSPNPLLAGRVEQIKLGRPGIYRWARRRKCALRHQSNSLSRAGLTRASDPLAAMKKAKAGEARPCQLYRLEGVVAISCRARLPASRQGGCFGQLGPIQRPIVPHHCESSASVIVERWTAGACAPREAAPWLGPLPKAFRSGSA